jgi:predicted component of type VI protein secretion system
MNVRLVVDRGGKRKVVPIREEQAVIGRSHGNTVRIPSAEVSRQHCRISKKDGLVMLRDLGSVNGTLLNGTRISAEEIVRPGDRVEVGPVTFVVEYELTPEALAHLHSLDAGLDVLSALADGEIVEDFDHVVPPSMEVDFDESLPLDEVEEYDEGEAVAPPKKKPARALDDTPTRPADDLSPLPADFDFDAVAWQMPEGGDLRGLLDDEEEKPKKKGKK